MPLKSSPGKNSPDKNLPGKNLPGKNLPGKHLPAKVLPTKILIVDDEIALARLLEFKLLKEGFEVCKAANGLEAVEIAQRYQPDAILMDYMMPELDGLSAMMRIKAEMRPAPPVLIVTAKSEVSSIKKAFDSGADDYITKPFSLSDLMARLNVALVNAGKLHVDGVDLLHAA
jgi:two-component system OmpR family response regulator